MRTLLLTSLILAACGGGDDDGAGTPDAGTSLLISNKTDVVFTSIAFANKGNVLSEPLERFDNVTVPDVPCGNYGVDVVDDSGGSCELEVELCESWFIEDIDLEQCIGQ